MADTEAEDLIRNAAQLSLPGDTQTTSSAHSPPPTNTSSTDDTRHTLLGLPAEIKNQIFELAMPTGTVVCISAEELPTSNKAVGRNCSAGKARFRFHPATPALYNTCRRLRTEFPIAAYYTNNNFLVNDSMFCRGLLSAFTAGRKATLKYVSKVRVLHKARVAHAFQMHRHVGQYFTYVFDAEVAGERSIAITANKIVGASDTVEDQYFAGLDSPCLCTIETCAAESGSALLRMVCKFIDKVGERRKNLSGAYLSRGNCMRCGRTAYF